MKLVEASPVLPGTKVQDPQVPGSVKAVYYAGLDCPSQSPQLTTSSVGSKDRVTVPAQHDAVHSGVAILVKVPVAQVIHAGQKETSVYRN